LIRGEEVLIISTGILTQTAVKVAEQLHALDIDCGVLDLFRLKPLNRPALLENLRQARRIVIMEEQTPVGGIGSLICEMLGEHAIAVPVRRYCLPDAPCYRYGTREWLHEQFGLDAATVARDVAEWIHLNSGARAELADARMES
jgi:transketolase